MSMLDDIEELLRIRARDAVDEPLDVKDCDWLVAEVKSLRRMLGRWKADERRRGHPDANDVLRARVRALEAALRKALDSEDFEGVAKLLGEDEALAAGEPG